MNVVIGTLVVLCLVLMFIGGLVASRDPIRGNRIWLWSIRVMMVIAGVFVLKMIRLLTHGLD